MNSYDVIVVGAGPAGSTAAKLLTDRGIQTLLLDRKRFPRHKTCASWVNRLAFEQFTYLQPQRDALVDTAFHGMTFWDGKLERSAAYPEKEPSGYLTLRSKFDNGLKDIAVQSGCHFMEGTGLRDIEAEWQPSARGEQVKVFLDDGSAHSCRVLIGADGANSKVAHLAGFRKGWRKDQYVMCANEDIPYDPQSLEEFYGPRSPIHVVLRYRGIEGYGWLFPKKEHVCIGIGGRLQDDRDIRQLYCDFLAHLRRRKLVPEDLKSEKVHYALDPAGAVIRLETTVRGRVLLIGDAAGFVSGSTGEGIYPAMMSASCAAGIVAEALKTSSVETCLRTYDQRWKDVLGSYLKCLPGGKKRGNTLNRIDLIFKSSLVCRVAARSFLYGEGTGLRQLWGSLWRR